MRSNGKRLESQENKPNIIIADIMMPVDGFQMTRLLKSDKSTANIPTSADCKVGENERINNDFRADVFEEAI